MGGGQIRIIITYNFGGWSQPTQGLPSGCATACYVRMQHILAYNFVNIIHPETHKNKNIKSIK